MKKKHYLPTILIIIALSASFYYVFFRENEIEVNLDKGKYIIREKIRNIELDRFPIRLQLDFDKLLKDFKSIQLRKEWSTDLPFDLTQAPYFDLRNLYLISFDKIAVYDKSNMQILWKLQVNADIASFSLIDGNNLLIIDINNNFYALNRSTGEISWSHYFEEIFIEPGNFTTKPFQISFNEDKRLLTSIIILPVGKNLKILDSVSGDELFVLEIEDYIYNVSEYDQIENAIYISYGNKISKIILEKK